jgi:hypothetical protein
MAMPPTPRERSRAPSQASSMIGLPPSHNESRASSIRDYAMPQPDLRGNPFAPLPQPDLRDNPFAPLPQRGEFLVPPPRDDRIRLRPQIRESERFEQFEDDDRFIAPPPREPMRVRIRASDTYQGPAPLRTPPRSIRQPSIRSQDSDPSDYQSFSTQDEFYTPRGSMHSRRDEDDDYEYRR